MAITGNWRLGLLLAATTATLWGLLPIALKGLLNAVDLYTVTFVRFFFSAALLLPWVLLRRELPAKAQLSRANLRFLAAGAALLCINYIAYQLGLDRITPEAAQITIQTAPLLLLLAGVWLFNEPFSARRWACVALFIVGMGLFFHHRLGELFNSASRYGVGIWIILFAALTWAGYGIFQKKVAGQFSAQFSMLVFCSTGAAVFAVPADFASLAALNGHQWALLLFAGANTLVAYGAFAEALNHLEASRVSAILTLTPLVTVTVVHLLPLPGVVVEPLTWLSLGGALMVVAGSMGAALLRR